MKKPKLSTLIICILTLCSFSIKGQETGKLRFGLEVGPVIPHEGGAGLAGAIELKYNIQDRMNIGLRTEKTGFFKHKSYSAELSSLSITCDYYIKSNNKILSPFGGVGLGYYQCEATDYSETIENKAYSTYNNPTCIIRLGTEIRKFRVSLAYNLIRKHSEANPSNRNCDNVSLYIGFYIGGGKWKTR